MNRSLIVMDHDVRLKVASVAWDAIPDEGKRVYSVTCELADDSDFVIHDDDDELDVSIALIPCQEDPVYFWMLPWLSSELVDVYRSAPTGILCALSLVLSEYGTRTKDPQFLSHGDGGWWKTTEYCDQEVRRRHDIPEYGVPYEEQRGLQLNVHQGLIRIEAEIRRTYGRYWYCGLATEKNMKAAREAPWPRVPEEYSHQRDYEEWFVGVCDIATKLSKSQIPTKGVLAPFWTKGLVPGHEEEKVSGESIAETGHKKRHARHDTKAGQLRIFG